MRKTFINAQSLLDDSFRLATEVYQSGLKPDFIVGIWRGGAPVGIAVQEYMDHMGIETDHIAIRTSFYNGIDERRSAVRVHGLGYICDQIKPGHTLLLVDDVFDTGLSMKAVLDEIVTLAGTSAPRTIKIATVYYKPARRQTDETPDFYIHKTNDWLVFPHELHGLTREEIARHKSPAIAAALKGS